METCGDYCEASQMPMVYARQDGRPRNNRSSPDEGKQAPVAVATLWADVPMDILGTVLRFLPCLADRASMRSVCHHWRATAHLHTLPAPLPVLVLPRFRFSCLTSDGALTAARRAPMPVEVTGDDVRVVGSFDDWLIAVRPSRDVNRETDGECFLVNAFSSNVIHLPPLRPCHYARSAQSSSDLVRTALGLMEPHPWLHRGAVLSASPSSGSKYIVAALSCSTAAKFLGLVLWQPGMTSWYLCPSVPMKTMDYGLAFYQGKLYMVCQTRPKIFAFELRENEHGVSLSRPHVYTMDPLIPSERMRCNMVVWRGKLILIIRSFGDYTTTEYKPRSVKVFLLDISTRPYGFTQIHNFDGDCIFVQKSSSRTFSAGLDLGVQGDLIYFCDEYIHQNCFPYVYNMKDHGTVSPFAARLPEGCIGFPIWIFPSS